MTGEAGEELCLAWLQKQVVLAIAVSGRAGGLRCGPGGDTAAFYRHSNTTNMCDFTRAQSATGNRFPSADDLLGPAGDHVGRLAGPTQLQLQPDCAASVVSAHLCSFSETPRTLLPIVVYRAGRSRISTVVLLTKQLF